MSRQKLLSVETRQQEKPSTANQAERDQKRQNLKTKNKSKKLATD